MSSQRKKRIVKMDHGTDEERAAVRAALEALKVLNRKLEDCVSLGITCRLEPAGRGYAAEFIKTTRVFP
jgi:hypothetical protein